MTATGAPAGVGAAVRSRRKAAGLTLVELAERTGLSQPFLSQVENDRAAPSMPSLYRIASALGTTPQALFTDRFGEPHLVRASDDIAEFGASGDAVRRLLLTGSAPFHVIELALPEKFGEPWVHHGTEALFVLGGRVVVEVDGQLHRLGPGDFMSYPAELPHRHRGSHGARALLIETERSSSGCVG